MSPPSPTPSSPRPHHRPSQPGSRFFETVDGGTDPAEVAVAAERAAVLLVRGARHAAGAGDDAVADRVVRLAESEGLDALAELWSQAPPLSVAGSLWRLYLLRSWVWGDPVGAAREFDAGRLRAPVARVVAGVAEPPGPEELKAMVDQVLRGIAERDLADVLFRAAAFARVVAHGRSADDVRPVASVLTLAEQLEAAGHAELAGRLG